MKTIRLSQGYETVVDDIDYDILSHFSWCVKESSGNLYAFRRHCYMHRRIVFLRDGKLDSNLVVNHKDFNTLNNTRDNLELITFADNNRKRQKRSDSRQLYRGIVKVRQTYEARLQVGKVRFLIGKLKTPEEAARAYDKLVLTHLGTGYPLNFPQ